MKGRFLIVGAGEVGQRLSILLAERGYDLVVVDAEVDSLQRLSGLVDAYCLRHGDGTDSHVLEAAGIRSADAVAAVTGTDATNLVIASLARFECQVPKVIARVNMMEHSWLFVPEMGVDVALNQADLMARLIEDQIERLIQPA
ncbi:MAG: TrkA family potassium uptake protein [Armatimonadetes bacterium]|nr:TrkA family potassium uptake protein [Armatimonadota bacterium]